MAGNEWLLPLGVWKYCFLICDIEIAVLYLGYSGKRGRAEDDRVEGKLEDYEEDQRPT